MKKQRQSLVKLFVLSAPSGTGKTTLTQALVEKYGKIHNLEKVITYTTRKQRVGEIHGIDYYFISQDEFEQKVAQDFFLEWSHDYGACYGCPKTLLEQMNKGKSLIAILDRKGACNIKAYYEDAVLIWIEPSNIEILYERLQKRDSEVKEDVLHRLNLAKKEIELEKLENLFKYCIINEDFDKALKSLALIIANELK